jgi:hypothetical protein
VLVIKEITKHSEIGKGVLVALGAVLTAAAVMAIVAWWPVLAPILAVLAAVAALALAVDDFIVFMRGGDSVLGDFFDEILGPGGAEKAQQAIKDFWEDIKGVVSDVKNFLGLLNIRMDAAGWVLSLKDILAQTRKEIEFIIAKFNQLKEIYDNVGHFLGGGSSDIKATTTVAAALASPNFRTADVAPPPEIGPPTASQAAVYGGPGGPPGAGGITVNGNVDSAELVNKVKRVVTDHNEEKINNILRDAFAGAGGTK